MVTLDHPEAILFKNADTDNHFLKKHLSKDTVWLQGPNKVTQSITQCIKKSTHLLRYVYRQIDKNRF